MPEHDNLDDELHHKPTEINSDSLTEKLSGYLDNNLDSSEPQSSSKKKEGFK